MLLREAAVDGLGQNDASRSRVDDEAPRTASAPGCVSRGRCCGAGWLLGAGLDQTAGATYGVTVTALPSTFTSETPLPAMLTGQREVAWYTYVAPAYSGFV